MQIREEHYATRASAPIHEGGFVIGDDAHLIKLLRDSLYSNPILAICREIASNARDAHREIGTPERPIFIEYPNVLNDNIIFRDWGPGISPVRIDTVYRQIGNSTKRSSNKETGGFGLGAKTPFAYTASFIVDTISVIEIQFDVDILNKANETNFTLEEVKGKNIKCNYICALGGECGPNGSVKLYSANITDEHTGTTVTIGVQSQDRNRFKQAVVQSTKHWDVKPEICGSDDREWPKLPPEIIKGESWSLHEKSDPGQFAIVDGIEYPLKISALIDTCKVVVQKQILKALSEARFYVYAQTGDVSLTPNREELQYNTHTLDFLFGIVNDIISSLEGKLIDKISACQTYRDASIELSVFNKNVLRFDKELHWKGNRVYSDAISLGSILHESIQNFIEPKILVRMQTYNWRFSSRGKCEEKLFRDNKNSKWNPTHPILICEGDSVSRLAVEAFQEKHPDKKTFHVLVPVGGDVAWLVSHVKDKLGINLFEIGSEFLSKYIPTRTKTTRKARQVGSSPAWQLGTTEWEEICNIDREDGEGVYVSLMNRKTTIKTDIGGNELGSVMNLIKIVRLLGITNDEVYGVKDDIIPKLGSGWRSLRTLIEEAKVKLYKKYPVELRKKLYLASLVNDRSEFRNFKEIINHSIGNHDFDVLKNLFEQVEADENLYAQARDEFTTLGLTYLEGCDNIAKKEDHELSKQLEMINKKYPMLRFVDRWKIPTSKDVLKQYIELMDLVEEADKIEEKLNTTTAA